ncbi:MAG: beta-ketoacyl-ACP synthase II [Chloroflexota bacterium]|nr:beta-ketoacyl-ACP synthase II [Chloroflexota bacterium]
MERKRVVVTGMGALCPVGNSVAEAWHNASQGITGIDYIQRFNTDNIDIKIGGEVKNFDPSSVMDRKDVRRADRVTHLAVAATKEAMDDSGLVITDDNRYDIGVLIGSGIGGISSIYDSIKAFLERGAKAVSPFMVPMMLPEAASSKISMMYGLRGPNFAISTACATGNNCIGEATEMIRRGQCVAVLAGGTEAGVMDVALASFNNMTALSQRNNDPKRASRPFDVDRDGFVAAEGAGVLVLEELGHAIARGAKIYAEILGYGHTSDAYHVTAPLDTGDGAMKAVQRALQDARIKPDQLDYINAHGTSTPLNDKSETLALKKALGEAAYEIPISSTKSMTGHMMGAGGAVEAIFCIKAMHESFIPPTVNLENQDPECDLNYTPNVGVAHEVNIAMSNAFGFGGHNAVVVLSKYNTNGHA